MFVLLAGWKKGNLPHRLHPLDGREMTLNIYRGNVAMPETSDIVYPT